MDLGELREFVETPALKFAIDGRPYTVGPASAEVWLKLEAISNRAAGATTEADIDQIGIVEFRRMVLGPVYDELVAAPVSGPDLSRASFTAYLWQLGREELAAAAWVDGEGKAPAPPKPKTSTSTGGATTTRRRASTKATTSRRPSKPASKAVKARPGTTS